MNLMMRLGIEMKMRIIMDFKILLFLEEGKKRRQIYTHLPNDTLFKIDVKRFDILHNMSYI